MINILSMMGIDTEYIEKKDDTVHIFYACDEDFIKYAAVSVRSLIDNASRQRDYVIHILHSNIVEQSRARFAALACQGFKIVFDDVSEHLQRLEQMLPLRDYYSNTTYYRMFIADMFPELDKAVYVDSDTVIQGDISKLFDYDVSDYDIAACHEQAMVQVDVYGSYVEKNLGIDRNAFFNAGVLLINCKRFREERLMISFGSLLEIYNFRVTQDEDYLNVICRDHVLWLPQEWNTEVFGSIAYPIEQANIIHYIMTSKPWHYEDCRFGEIFWKYAQKTQYHDEILEVLKSYSDEERARDKESEKRLYALAISETEREDTFVRRISKWRDEGRVRIVEKIERYEREGRFDEDVEDDAPGREIKPGEVDYMGKRLGSRMQGALAFSMARWYLNSIIGSGKMIIKDIVGIENFKALQSGALITCNHFNAFDSFAIQLAYEASGHKKRRFYRVIREGNYTSFPGFFGYLMRHCNTLPLSSNPNTMKEFSLATRSLLEEGNFILVYPEQSMWWNYRKPKPLKSGGFYIAAKNNVPVLPCFITMKDSKNIGEDGFPIQEYTIHVAPPIYPKEGRSMRENTRIMMEENARIWKSIYEREYGIPLRYATERVAE